MPLLFLPNDHKLTNNIPLQTLQHSPSSWIWSSIGQFSLGQSWIGSWRVQLIRPLSQLHSTQRLGLCDDPCAIGTFKLVHPAKKQKSLFGLSDYKMLPDLCLYSCIHCICISICINKQYDFIWLKIVKCFRHQSDLSCAWHDIKFCFHF